MAQYKRKNDNENEKSSENKNRYVDLLTNGKIFVPAWIGTNYKKYLIPKTIIKDDDDPCKKTEKITIKKYQEFIAKYLDYRTPYKNILLYWSTGSGKTLSAINFYNNLYNYSPSINLIILTRASLIKSTWISELEIWLTKENYNDRMKNIYFISYDSPIADKTFIELMKNLDSQKRNIYVIDEAHNFIRNVYSNINNKKGRKAQIIYDYILQDSKENHETRIMLLTANPTINVPYELALLFNLLRPNIFPKSETTFNQLFVSETGIKVINPINKNLFQRRILGLVSYYNGNTYGYYASKKIIYVNIVMSQYQADIYKYFEEMEELMSKRIQNKKSETYKSYTRQACNFVFPAINQNVTGENRPRPYKFKITENDANKIQEAKLTLKNKKHSINNKHIQNYINALSIYINDFDNYLNIKKNEDDKTNYTIINDFKTYVEKYDGDYNKFIETEKRKSKLLEAMNHCSAKFVSVIFNILQSKGPVLVYSNYVLMEGLQILKIYLKYFGFSDYINSKEGTDGFRYTEYHGNIDLDKRALNRKIFNESDNKYGKIIKIILISPAGTEGISLSNVRQVHIIEPYWNEVRINQIIGRAIRICSHKNLPMNERHVDIYRYKSVRKDYSKQTTDQYIEELARNKEMLIQSFMDTIKEAAVDCILFKNANNTTGEYKCFQFDEKSLFDDHIGPAYKEYIEEDMKYNSGSNSLTSSTIRIKVKKIKAVKQLNPEATKFSKPEYYWYNSNSNVVYDYDLHFAIGKIGLDDDGITKKIDKDTYIIDKIIPIPTIE